MIAFLQKMTNYEAIFDEQGTLTEVSHEITFQELPRAVAAACHMNYPKSKIGEVYVVSKPGIAGKTFWVEIQTAKGKELEVIIAPSGNVLSVEEVDN